MQFTTKLHKRIRECYCTVSPRFCAKKAVLKSEGRHVVRIGVHGGNGHPTKEKLA